MSVILYKLRQNNSTGIMSAYKKWYAQPIITETVDTDGLAEHMAAHNTPFSKGAIKGILTDMVTCIKEQLVEGKAVKIDDLAIFKVSIVSKTGCEDKSEYKASEYIDHIALRATATGELAIGKLNTNVTLKRSSLDKDDEGDVDAEDTGNNSSGTDTGSTSTGTSGGGSNNDEQDGTEIV